MVTSLDRQRVVVRPEQVDDPAVVVRGELLLDLAT